MPNRYIETATGVVKTLKSIQREHPNTSLPANGSLTAMGYALIEPTDKPLDVPAGMIVVPGPPEEYEPGKWCESWLTIDAPEPAEPDPVMRVTALQGLLAIDVAGLSEQYEAWAKDPARTFAERAFIDRAQYWERNDQTLVSAATALGLGDAQIDALFETAAQL